MACSFCGSKDHEGGDCDQIDIPERRPRCPPELPVLERDVFPPQPPLIATPPTPAYQGPPTNTAVHELLSSLFASVPGAAAMFPLPQGAPLAAPRVPEAPGPDLSASTPDQFRHLVGKLSGEELLQLVRGDDATAVRLQKAACGVPPHLSPDLCFEDPRFKEARAMCNVEMMRRCKSLCTPKTRSALTDNPGECVPYVMRAQARRNLQKVVPLMPFDCDTFNFNVFLTWLTRNSPYTMKRDALPEMICKVAASIADESQAHLESGPASAEMQLIPASTIRALAQGCVQTPAQAAAAGAAAMPGQAPAEPLPITLEDLKNYSFDRLHDRSGTRTLDWALEDRAVTAEDPATLRKKFESYHAAFKTLALKAKGTGKGKAKSKEAGDVFKRISEALGVKFDATRVSRSPRDRKLIIAGLALLQDCLLHLYSFAGSLPWDCIFVLHRLGFVLARHFLMATTHKFYARIRLLAATLPGATWPPTEALMDAPFVVYLMWSPWRRLFYIGKTIYYKERLRKHLYAFLRPSNDSQQPYMAYLRHCSGGDAPSAAASWLYLPIARFSSDAAASSLERHLIDVEHPRLNEPHVHRLLALCGPASAPVQWSARGTRISAAPPTAPARFTQRRRHGQDVRPRAAEARLALSDSGQCLSCSITRWAQLACNTLPAAEADQGHSELYRLTSTELFAVWRRIHRSQGGATKAIGLRALDRIRRFRRWPKPRLCVQGAAPWLPGASARTLFRDLMHRIIGYAREHGQVAMIPAIRDFRIMLTPSSCLTLRSALRNAPRYYRQLGTKDAWPCACHLHPDLPRYPSPDGASHIFAPQDTWAWPAHLQQLRFLPAHTSAAPSRDMFFTSCNRVLRRACRALGLNCSDATIARFTEEALDTVDFGGIPQQVDFQPIDHEAIAIGRRLTRGLVVEEFQKSRHVLVAECPRRVQLLCHGLFGVDGSDPSFEYFPGLSASWVLQQASVVVGVRKCGSDITNCFSNIPHPLVRRAWHYYRSVLTALDIVLISAPRRRGQGRCLPHAAPPSSRQYLEFNLADMEASIEHSLKHLWLAVGSLIGRAIDGLAMGSSLAGALTRMVLVYADVTFHASLYSSVPPPPASRGRVRYVDVLGVQILVLESRYMDDYICIWKGPPGLQESLASRIASVVASWPGQRYPLPSEPDQGDVITGMRLALLDNGTVATRPASVDPPGYAGHFDYPPFLHYCSFVPVHIKRAIVLGAVARVDRFTTPEENKPEALLELARALLASGFPAVLMSRWMLSRRGASTPGWLQRACFQIASLAAGT
ncbi:unnamed protein product [Prorocentrum cordatum]|uniref:Helix-turn-helix domain-containing protein n=1 Tax=Prorocentrum cordatum TaxID=2364126 RepID=A0ABN9UJR4_9DINO|nr:unnamed protein product [Polarella glacialis]